ncbi:quinone-dependent dihydroorotate dehydrogenase [Idiomarina xiamenensis]|uniref:Dihydroorotate dehydrogenase (quinone) n=1 Tax=Idiomarina xiamenensis 10-D-4 TaxID=740709 RepID=K2KK35_9GAMM|nr:quinone-dependent dihydroorotate dehydrogenase [Idiomarina xiamenensis]EKE87027.1 dihydro-orotate oxidase, FMN-linked [Idiomarina xiamenensis 10-D-4]
MLYALLRRFLFSRDAEWSHDVTLSLLSRYARTPLRYFWQQRLPAKPVRVMGIDFPNAVGLAAGLDKNARCIEAFAQMGFGFIEVGTVTPRPQPGNPQPRLFRLPQKRAIINRMGFNNEGVDALVERVKATAFDGVLGINIGKNKDTPDEQGVDDYIYCMRRVYPYASYITVNISSPNTPGLRAFQHGSALANLLSALKHCQLELAQQHQRYVPVAVKIAPDLSDEDIQHMAIAIKEAKLDAIIATNTTLERSQVEGLPHAEEAGGLSGLPVRDSSTHVIKVLHQTLQGELPIIGVGGIDDAASAKQKLAAGASLVQVYTGFIYRGPALVKDIVKQLS